MTCIMYVCLSVKAQLHKQRLSLYFICYSPTVAAFRTHYFIYSHTYVSMYAYVYVLSENWTACSLACLKQTIFHSRFASMSSLASIARSCLTLCSLTLFSQCHITCLLNTLCTQILFVKNAIKILHLRLAFNFSFAPNLKFLHCTHYSLSLVACVNYY